MPNARQGKRGPRKQIHEDYFTKPPQEDAWHEGSATVWAPYGGAVANEPDWWEEDEGWQTSWKTPTGSRAYVQTEMDWQAKSTAGVARRPGRWRKEYAGEDNSNAWRPSLQRAELTGQLYKHSSTFRDKTWDDGYASSSPSQETTASGPSTGRVSGEDDPPCFGIPMSKQFDTSFHNASICAGQSKHLTNWVESTETLDEYLTTQMQTARAGTGNPMTHQGITHAHNASFLAGQSKHFSSRVESTEPLDEYLRKQMQMAHTVSTPSPGSSPLNLSAAISNPSSQSEYMQSMKELPPTPPPPPLELAPLSFSSPLASPYTISAPPPPPRHTAEPAMSIHSYHQSTYSGKAICPALLPHVAEPAMRSTARRHTWSSWSDSDFVRIYVQQLVPTLYDAFSMHSPYDIAELLRAAQPDVYED